MPRYLMNDCFGLALVAFSDIAHDADCRTTNLVLHSKVFGDFNLFERLNCGLITTVRLEVK